MSFYGKIYQEVVDIFNRLKFKNNTSSNNFPTSTPAEITLMANGGEDAAIIEAGNKWIQFEKNGDLTCKMYHKKSGVTNKNIMTLTDKDDKVKKDTVIGYGDKIIIQTPEFDDAGHIVRHTQKTF
jgi:hypothetical protein